MKQIGISLVQLIIFYLLECFETLSASISNLLCIFDMGLLVDFLMRGVERELRAVAAHMTVGLAVSCLKFEKVGYYFS